MGISEKVFDVFKASMMLSEKVSVLDDKVNRMDQDLRSMNNRLVRMETIVEVAMAKGPDKQLHRRD